MQAKYSDDVQFYLVYTSEAHAADSNRPAGKDIEQPVTTEERREVAQNFLTEMGLEMPALLDNIDNKTAQDYASLPDRMYLVGKNGKITYAGERGPFGFKPDELADAIESEVGGKPKAETPRGQGQRGGNAQRGGGMQSEMMARMLSRVPAFSAINKDGDTTLSAEEIKGAAEALLTLDKDGDGELSAEELRPAGGGGRGGARGGAGGGRGQGGGRGGRGNRGGGGRSDF